MQINFFDFIMTNLITVSKAREYYGFGQSTIKYLLNNGFVKRMIVNIIYKIFDVSVWFYWTVLTSSFLIVTFFECICGKKSVTYLLYFLRLSQK